MHPTTQDSTRASRYLTLLFALVILVGYANGLQIPFHLDDHHVVEDNPHIRSVTNIPSFFVDPNRSSVNHQSKLLRPVLTTTYALNYAISGLDTWSYHVVNILIHWLVVVLVFRIVRDHLWLGSAGLMVAVAAALLVAAHPLNSEPVNYISSRSASLTALFYLGAFDAAVRRRRALCCTLFTLALLTKTIAVTLPAALIVYFLLRRLHATAPGDHRIPWRLITTLLVLDLAAGVYYWWFTPDHVAGAMGEPGVTPWMYFTTEWSAYLYYLRLFLWPDALVIDRKDYPIVHSLAEPQAWMSLLALLAIGRFAWTARRRWPTLAFAIFWYLIVLMPESTFFPLAEPVNEHRPYLAMLGMATAGAVGLWHLTRVLAGRYGAPVSWLFAVVLTLVTTACTASTIGRNETWRDGYTLWLDATRKAPRNPRAWLNVGHAELERGNMEAARAHLIKARDLAPCYHYVLINLSVVEARVGRSTDSLRWADDAVRCGPGLPLTHYYRGLALDRLERHDEAIEAYRQATTIDAYYVDAWFKLGEALERRDAWAEALAAYERAWAIDPAYTKAGMSAGVLYHYRLHDPATAVARYQAVLRRNPDHYGARYQIALAHHANGNPTEAREAWALFVPLAQAIGDTASIQRGAAVLRGAT